MRELLIKQQEQFLQTLFDVLLLINCTGSYEDHAIFITTIYSLPIHVILSKFWQMFGLETIVILATSKEVQYKMQDLEIVLSLFRRLLHNWYQFLLHYDKLKRFS